MSLFKPTSIVSIFYLNILIFCIQDNPAFSDFLFHGQKNPSLKKILNAESGNKEYEIVQLRILSKRSADDQNVIRVHLSAFGKDIDLRLQRDDDFTDRSKDVKFFEARFTDTVQLNEVILEEGVIGDDLLIKPAPTDINFLTDSFVYDRDFLDENGDSLNSSRNDASNFFGHSSTATTKSSVHIVYRSAMKSSTAFKVLDDAFNEIDSNDNERHHKRPLQVWPEVLLMVDYDTYAMHLSHGFNDTQIRRYYISFFNGVDLRFQVLSDPKISLILTQILIFKSRDAFPFLMKKPCPNQNIFEGYSALADLSRYLYSIKTQQQGIHLDFDVAVLLTKLDMCTDEIFDCVESTVGLAYFKGACKIKHMEDRWMGIAIVEDRGGFDGILTAVHEIGHLLGSIHDGDRHYSAGVEYTSFCKDDDGYIMSRVMLMENKIFQWSECSIKQIKYFLSSENASCLFNQPSYHNELEGSELPGVVLTLDEQCNRIWGTGANAWDSRVCASLLCHTPADRAPQRILPPAAEGSSCGKDLIFLFQHCRHGKCISKYLTYSQAWNMAPIQNIWDFINVPRSSTTTKPPFIEKACTEDKSEFFCDIYFWTIGSKEACKNGRILEECCYSHKLFCGVGSL
ncbi:unnamed protein product [Larinioides sclopetarius]|uniref:Peptidase M12B domain-containing protein n=1 Tax=Larinioides sclopetarius TaxID=280406 RepID=A0AAV2BLE5_9ARAC